MFPYFRYHKPPAGTPLNPNNPLIKGLVGYWPFLEGRGTKTIHDLSGKKNHGTIGGNPQWTAGKYGSCLDFDGGGDYVDMGVTDGIFTESDPVTISVWINPSSFGDNDQGRIIDRATGWYGPYFRVNSYNNLIFQVDGSTDLQAVSVDDCIVLNTWQHVVATWDGTTNCAGVFLYVNSIDVTSSRQNGVSLVDNSSAALRIGSMANVAAREFDGQIDNVMIFDRALSAAEIKSLYQEPWQLFDWQRRGQFFVPASGGTEETASFTALSLQISNPSTTATYQAETTASFTALSAQLATPATTATYTLEETASFTSLSIQGTIPSTTATREAQYTASYSALSVQVAFPSITATRVAEYTASITALGVQITNPSQVATYQSELSASFTALPIQISFPAITATREAQYSASFTALSAQLTIPAMTASHATGEVGNFTALSLQLTSPAMTPTYASELTGSFSALGLEMAVPAMGATSDVTTNPNIKLAGTFGTKPIKIKLGGSFTEKTMKIKVNDTWK